MDGQAGLYVQGLECQLTSEDLNFLQNNVFNLRASCRQTCTT